MSLFLFATYQTDCYRDAHQISNMFSASANGMFTARRPVHPHPKGIVEMSDNHVVSRRNLLKMGGAGSAAAGAGALLLASSPDVRAQSTSDTYVNVKDFGAAGDGSANDTVAIQQAIAAASGSGGSEFDRNQRGGVVFLPAGTYRVDQIRLNRNITLMGEGPGTIVDQADGNNTAVIAPSGATEYPVLISDLRIRGARNPGGDGRSARGILLDTQAAYGGFTVPDGQHIVNRVWIERTHAENIFIAHNCRGTLIADCWLRGSEIAAGLVIDGSDSTISNTISRGHASDGFRVTSGNTRMQNCKAFFCRGNGFLVTSSRANLSVCEAQDNWGNGFHIQSNDGLYTSCLADSNQFAGFNVDPRGGTLGGIVMTGFLTLGKQQVQASKPFVGQDVGLLLNNGLIRDSLFAGVARENNSAQLRANALLAEETQIAQVVSS